MTGSPTAAAVNIQEVAPTSAEAEQCLSQYYAEIAERFEGGFDPAQSITPTLDEFAPPAGTFLVMCRNGELVGCGGFKRLSADAVYLKRMWVAPEARGLGLGKLMLEALENRARELGYRKVRLETHKSLSEAQMLYRGQGYHEVPAFSERRYAHHWFEKIL
jgi:GNAT superfamily N-acetyltransferase